jgi:hypothetical protein
MQTYEEHQEKRRESILRQIKRQKAKRESTLPAALSRVKEVSRPDTWCTNHGNCFRCSVGDAESEKHARCKFDRFIYWRQYGATVFTELRLKTGDRPDLVICLNNGEIFIEEIAESEKEASLLAKKERYPFPMKVIRADAK